MDEAVDCDDLLDDVGNALHKKLGDDFRPNIFKCSPHKTGLGLCILYYHLSLPKVEKRIQLTKTSFAEIF